ncbi:MAG: enoyl-CoA hydratase/isomerase family protein [Sphingomonadales bacterium]|nr:enoyl-CoA hydratase/isomerase family protein [Sphingomonadales bacterium]
MKPESQSGATRSNAVRPNATDAVLYEKDRRTKIATITFNRPDDLNAMTVDMRLRFADLVHRANVDDDVKVLVIRGAGNHVGAGGDLPEQADMLSATSRGSLLREFRIGEDEDVRYPPGDSYRYLASLTQFYATTASGNRALQDFKKISILEVKGYCYGWHFYQAADVDLIVSSDDALFGHPAFRYVGWAPRMWEWARLMGLRKFQEMVFTGRPFTAREMKDLNFVNSMVPRDQLEAETMKYALACANTRPTDTVMMQKTFFEVFKQHEGEYMGSILSGWLESMLAQVKNEDTLHLGDDTFDKGLNNAVKDNDSLFPPEWRLSYKGRRS